MILYIFVVSDTFFISNFIDLSPFPVFIHKSGQRFISFVYLLKEPALISLILSIVLFSFVFHLFLL